ncbi:hypothetical protein D3C78_1886390 [compost metagenome]
MEQAAARVSCSKDWIIQQALAAWVDREEERSHLTSEALDDVDSGHVIDHQSVQAWATSLSTETSLPLPR